MIFDSLNMMKHGFKNYIFHTKTVGSDSEKWAQIQYKTYRFIDFSLLKSRTLVYFSALKSRALVDFGAVPLYQTKVPRASRIPGPTYTAPRRDPYGAYIRAGELEAASWKLGRRAGS